jgi:hydrogenase nickel incorporation protein HypA/HybF
MHELSIAATILEDVLGFAERQGATRVVRVRLSIGEFTCVQADQLKFCYESVTTDTLLANSQLEIETLPAIVACHSCRYEGPPKYWMDPLVPTLQCPMCGESVEAVQGHECAIKSVQYAA